MNRRHFLRSASALCATLALPDANHLFADTLASDPWRLFEVTTRVEVLKPSGSTRVWLPAALIRNTRFQKTLANRFHAAGGRVRMVEISAQNMGVVDATFPAGAKPLVTLTSRVALRNYSVDLSAPGRAPRASRAELDYFLRPSKLVPTGGLVKATATKITEGAKTDVEKARALYQWIVENTFRDPKVRGCGRGDILFMLESHDLGGKCADLNALYVGLARSVGLPARDVYGIRVAPSQLGFKSLGVSSENVSKAQHCRAEVYLQDYGWVPVDPADVRKVMLEEPPGNRPLGDAMVQSARTRLFGSWEMNWMAFNFSHDVELPGSGGAPLGFLMYPQAETAEGRLDSLDPDNFKYEVTAREIAKA